MQRGILADYQIDILYVSASICIYLIFFFYSRYNSYIARNQLAAIDYQEHKDRDIQKDKKGHVRYVWISGKHKEF